MKAYLLITGTLFALIGAMHLGSLIQHWNVPGQGAFDGILGTLSASLAVWAFLLVATTRRRAA
jgi:hypothetical protein